MNNDWIKDALCFRSDITALKQCREDVILYKEEAKTPIHGKIYDFDKKTAIELEEAEHFLDIRIAELETGIS
jgi:hypothetical protein